LFASTISAAPLAGVASSSPSTIDRRQDCRAGHRSDVDSFAVEYIADHDRPSTREAPLAKAALVAGRQRDNSRAHAREAPDDYFGRQLREAASDETKRCADIAAKREAAPKNEQPG